MEAQDMQDTLGAEHPELSRAQKAFLAYAAQRYIWWESTNGALTSPQRIIAHVMNIGSWGDMCKLVEFFPQQELINVLNKAEIGQFNERSWHFWNNRFSDKIPPMPQRVMS
jgi:hypothetical protein